MADEKDQAPAALADLVKEQTDKMQSAMERLDSFVSKIFESRQAYYEKLTLLNGATLTLLFSAMGLLAKGSSPGVKVEMISHVFAGCWMLVVSIIICIVHNYINLYYLFHGNASVIAFTMNTSRRTVIKALIKAGAPVKDDDFPGSENSDIHGKYVSRTEKLCRVLGVLAQALTIAAYIEFLKALHRIFLSL